MSNQLTTFRLFDGHVDNYMVWRDWLRPQYAYYLQDDGTLSEEGNQKLVNVILTSVTGGAGRWIEENMKELKKDPMAFLKIMDQQFGGVASDDTLLSQCDRTRAQSPQDSLRVIDDIHYLSKQLSKEAVIKLATIVALDRIHPTVRDRIDRSPNHKLRYVVDQEARDRCAGRRGTEAVSSG